MAMSKRTMHNVVTDVMTTERRLDSEKKEGVIFQWTSSATVNSVTYLNFDTLLTATQSTENNNPIAVTSMANVDLVTNDYVEMFIENQDGTTDINLEISNFLVRR